MFKIKNKFVLLLKNMSIRILMSIKRFPEAIIMASCAALLSVIINHLEPNTSESTLIYLKRTVYILALGFPAFLSIKIFFEKKHIMNLTLKIWIHVLCLLFLYLYFLLLLPSLNNMSLVRYSAYTIVLYLLFLIIPKYKINDSYELYILKLFISLIITYLYCIILYGGISAIIGSTQLLFKLRISSKVYLDIAIIIAGILAPILFLSNIPKYNEQLSVSNYPKVLRILFLYIILPMLSIFLVILYIYFIRILFKPWPNNTIFKIIFFFLLSSIISLFTIYPLININKWAKIFEAIFPKLLLPLLVIMFLSLITRIKAYGITEVRYITFAASLWISFSLLYLCIAKHAKNIAIFISFAVLAFLVVTGPLNYSALTKSSQNARFESILTKYSMIQGNTIVKSSKTVSTEDKISVSSIISYYENNYNYKDLKYLPKHFNEEKMLDVFGFEMTYFQNTKVPIPEEFYYTRLPENSVINIKDYDYSIEIMNTDTSVTKITNNSLEVIFEKDINTLTIKKDSKKIYSKNLTDFINKIQSSGIYKQDLTSEKMNANDSNENLDALFIFNSITINKNESESNYKIDSMNLQLLIKLKK